MLSGTQGNRTLVSEPPRPPPTTYRVGQTVTVTRDTTPGLPVRSGGTAKVMDARWAGGAEVYDVEYVGRLGSGQSQGLPVTALRTVPAAGDRSRRTSAGGKGGGGASSSSNGSASSGGSGGGGGGTDWEALFRQQQVLHAEELRQVQERYAETLANHDETIRAHRRDAARLAVALEDAKTASKQADTSLTESAPSSSARKVEAE